MSMVWYLLLAVLFPLRFLYADTATLEVVSTMTRGGDDRVAINPVSGLNKYFTTPGTCTDVICRSSCTSSYSSMRGYAAAQDAYESLRAADWSPDLFKQKMGSLHEDLLKFLVSDDLRSQCSLITTPSGSDAEMIPSIVALVRHPHWNSGQARIVNILVAGGEIGSGSAYAAGLRHFSLLTPRGESVQVAQCMEGVSDAMVRVEQIKARKEDGSFVEPELLEKGIKTGVEQALASGAHVVLHVVEACKTGVGMPTLDFAQDILRMDPEKISVVVDAAQFRGGTELIAQALQAGMFVFVTGSKFMGGPSFSAAVIAPTKAFSPLRNIANLPVGLSAYLNAANIPEHLEIKLNGNADWMNVGLLLRWTAALEELRYLQQIPATQRNAIAQRWALTITDLVRACNGLKIVDTSTARWQATARHLLAAGESIIPITLVHEGRYASEAQLKRVYQLMASDCAKLLKDAGASEAESELAAQKCLLGQPVVLGAQATPPAVLRIALGAPMLVDVVSAADQDLELARILEQDNILIRKLALLVKYWESCLS